MLRLQSIVDIWKRRYKYVSKMYMMCLLYLFAIIKAMVKIELIYLTKTGPRSTLGSLAATAAVLASNVTAVRMNFIISFVLMIIGRLIIVKSK